jgi:maleylacetate reductase
MTNDGFTYEPHPARVVFGAGARSRLAEEVTRLGIHRPLLIAAPRHVAEASRLGLVAAGTFEETVMHVPVDVAARGLAACRSAEADGLVAFGGGSAIGVAKAVARETGLPILAIPTTYAGSEMTSVWGVTEGGRKTTGRDPRVRPKTVLYDPELVVSLPKEVAGPSGLNAIAHAMEALYAAGADPVTQLFAEESVAKIAGGLARAVATAQLSDVSDVVYGAWLAGVCLDRAAMGIHHKLCHVLGGSFGLSHAGVHAVILPYAAAFNRAAAPVAMKRLARALGADDAPTALFALARSVGAPASLAALGMKEGDLDRAAEIAVSSPYSNPRPVDRAGVRALLADAFVGNPPLR